LVIFSSIEEQMCAAPDAPRHVRHDDHPSPS